MSVLESRVDVTSAVARENRAHLERLVAELRDRLAAVRAGGGERAIERHRSRGKLLGPRADRPAARSRHARSSSSRRWPRWACTATTRRRAGIVTGIGPVHGQECVIVANDATVKGGTYYPLTVKKHLRAQEIAAQNGLPCIYLVDSGGAFLPLQDEVFPDRDHFGRIFYNQATMSARGIPQLAAVMGSCTAGGAYVPAMSDETVIVRGTGTIFLGGPPLVKAATGEEVTAEELGGADVHTRISGVADELRGVRRARPGAGARQSWRTLERQRYLPWELHDPRSRAHDPAELYDIVPADTAPARTTCARSSRGSSTAPACTSSSRCTATTLVCGFARIWGYPVGDPGQQRDPLLASPR